MGDSSRRRTKDSLGRTCGVDVRGRSQIDIDQVPGMSVVSCTSPQSENQGHIKRRICCDAAFFLQKRNAVQ